MQLIAPFPASAWAVLLPLLPLSQLVSGQAVQPAFNQTQLVDFGSDTYDTRAWGIGIADFNQDTIPDIIAGDTAGDVRLFLGDGNGNFNAQGIVINQLFHDAYSIAAGDFNGDDFADFVLARTTDENEGQLHLYLGNGDGSFQVTGTGTLGEQLGVQIGVAGLDPVGLAAGDVDSDGDLDLVSGERVDTTVVGDTADIILWRNQLAQGSALGFLPETLIQGVDRGFTPDAEQAPYYPPKVRLDGYGLAIADVTGDDVPDLIVGDTANYLYIYENTGGGAFTPLRYDNISTGTRPFAFGRLENIFNEGLCLSTGDFNRDGLIDIVSGNAGLDSNSPPGSLGHQVKLWVNEGLDDSDRPQFTGTGVIGTAGTNIRGLASGQLDPAVDTVPDIAFGNLEGEIHGLFPDLTDTDGDGLIDQVDNAPNEPNAPRIDMNTDLSINVLDQLDNDGDGTGDPADDDDDNDGIPDVSDNAPFTANADQTDSDGDGVGDAADPFNNRDGDGDGLADGPIDPVLYAKAIAAKGQWARSDTHFIIRIDALARAFQNEFVQTFTDGAILTPGEWETHKFDSYNGIGDAPASEGYNVPADLPGGMDCPVTVATIPRLIWNAFGDPDPINWINARITNPNLEISLHGTYHTNNVPLSDWAELEDRNVYSSEFAGLTLEENYQLLRVGQRSLLGDYASDPWILDSGIDPATAPKIDWSIAANPLISYAPPYNTADTTSRDATARLGFVGYSASIAEEEGFLAPFFSPEGSHHEAIDQFGMFHASADLEVDPEAPPGQTYLEFLQSITQTGQLNTWLIEEVSWSTRYCNNIERLEPCPTAPGGINRENNMIDENRWANWLTLLSYAKSNGEVMTMGDYALAMQTDNAPTVPNPDQSDVDHDGIGDVIDDATLGAVEVEIEGPAINTQALLSATLRNSASTGIPGQTITFWIDTDGDQAEESFSAITGADGTATVGVFLSGPAGESFSYRASWDGGPLDLEDADQVTVVPVATLRVTRVDYTPGGAFELTVDGLDPAATYRLVRSSDLNGFPDVVVSGFTPAAVTDTLRDPDPPAERAFYRVIEED